MAMVKKRYRRVIVRARQDRRLAAYWSKVLVRRNAEKQKRELSDAWSRVLAKSPLDRFPAMGPVVTGPSEFDRVAVLSTDKLDEIYRKLMDASSGQQPVRNGRPVFEFPMCRNRGDGTVEWLCSEERLAEVQAKLDEWERSRA